jgi:hypothetical protein
MVQAYQNSADFLHDLGGAFSDHHFQSTGCSPCPEGFGPSLTWQRQQVADFSEVRQVGRLINEVVFDCLLRIDKSILDRLVALSWAPADFYIKCTFSFIKEL